MMKISKIKSNTLTKKHRSIVGIKDFYIKKNKETRKVQEALLNSYIGFHQTSIALEILQDIPKKFKLSNVLQLQSKVLENNLYCTIAGIRCHIFINNEKQTNNKNLIHPTTIDFVYPYAFEDILGIKKLESDYLIPIKENFLKAIAKDKLEQEDAQLARYQVIIIPVHGYNHSIAQQITIDSCAKIEALEGENADQARNQYQFFGLAYGASISFFATVQDVCKYRVSPLNLIRNHQLNALYHLAIILGKKKLFRGTKISNVCIVPEVCQYTIEI